MTTVAKVVAVDNSSLYIWTTPLASNGKFHWGFVHVDHNGCATRHHWAIVHKHDILGPEHYAKEVLREGPKTASASTVILGYFKVTDYPATALEQFTDICQNVFPQSYQTAEANRDHGMTCRTWVLQVLVKLGQTQRRVKEIEDSVIQRSTVLANENLNAFLWRKEFEGGRIFSV